jgi:TonB-dependent SusC/RagA subfamily outer membrane receptor
MRNPGAVVVLCAALAAAAACGRSAPPASGAQPQAAPAGRGAAPRSGTTGSVDSLTDVSTGTRQVDDIAALLQGRVAGLQVIRLPNGDISLRIRGIDSKESLGEPLLVVDGMPVSEQAMTFTLRALRPSEIARIDVLKDVSSTSGYGMRGAHGVILITTKRDR